MQLNLSLYPDGLDQYLFQAIERKVSQAEDMDVSILIDRVRDHIIRSQQAAQQNPMVHLSLANAIGETYDAVFHVWETVSPHAQPWLKGAMLYFADPDDDEPDFESPIGFDDDVEVLNACLKMAKLEHLCLNLEDYD